MVCGEIEIEVYPQKQKRSPKWRAFPIFTSSCGSLENAVHRQLHFGLLLDYRCDKFGIFSAQTVHRYRAGTAVGLEQADEIVADLNQSPFGFEGATVIDPNPRCAVFAKQVVKIGLWLLSGSCRLRGLAGRWAEQVIGRCGLSGWSIGSWSSGVAGAASSIGSPNRSSAAAGAAGSAAGAGAASGAPNKSSAAAGAAGSAAGAAGSASGAPNRSSAPLAAGIGAGSSAGAAGCSAGAASGAPNRSSSIASAGAGAAGAGAGSAGAGSAGAGSAGAGSTGAGAGSAGAGAGAGSTAAGAGSAGTGSAGVGIGVGVAGAGSTAGVAGTGGNAGAMSELLGASFESGATDGLSVVSDGLLIHGSLRRTT